jgi:putative zinc finger/helix-turn-helix YgiT family protein
VEDGAMNCLECGKPLKVTRETIVYRQAGLPNVRLRDIEVRRCPKDGESYEVIPRIEELHALLARAVATKPAKLTPEEVVFLRKWLGWDRVEFAKRMDVQPETISRWENGSQKISGTTERLLRLMALTQQPKHDYTLDMIKEVAHGSPKPVKVEVAERDHEWALATA